MDQDTTKNLPKAPATKAATVSKMLARNRGVTLNEIMVATSWQPHSCRAFLSGLRKKGANILRESRKDGDTSYRTVK